MATFIVNSGAFISEEDIPIYFSQGYGVQAGACVEAYVEDVFPATVFPKLGPGMFAPKFLTAYTGAAAKHLTIEGYTCTEHPADILNPIVAALFYNDIEITVFPFQIDIEGIAPGDTFNFKIKGSYPKCEEGYTVAVSYNIQDIDDLTGDTEIFEFTYTHTS